MQGFASVEASKVKEAIFNYENSIPHARNLYNEKVEEFGDIIRSELSIFGKYFYRNTSNRDLIYDKKVRLSPWYTVCDAICNLMDLTNQEEFCLFNCIFNRYGNDEVVDELNSLVSVTSRDSDCVLIDSDLAKFVGTWGNYDI